MSSSELSESRVFDTVKLILALLLVIGSLVAYYYFAQESQLYRVLGVVATCLVAVGIISTTSRGRSLLGFFGDVRSELKKVVWPTKPETMQTTLIVLVMVLIVGIILWLFDMFFFWGIQTLTGQVA